jgi:predicted tellurium resistance membrane protein TerC
MEWLLNPEHWISLVTLTALEIVLGIDNIIFLSIVVSKMPPYQQPSARIIGLGAAMIMRILLLLSLTWVMRLTEPLFHLLGRAFAGRDIILILGGLFLIAKSSLEIHEKMEEARSGGPDIQIRTTAFWGVIVQIMLLDIIFSLDSVITAVGMAREIWIMIAAIVIAVGIMMFAAGPIGDFVDQNPTIKVLALSFLILVGVALLGDGFSFHIPKGYIYFAMAFSFAVEMINIRVRKGMS